MKNKLYYWKVVSKMKGSNNSEYKSCSIIRGPFSCLYSTNEWTISKVEGNGLFVFKTRKDARYFRTYYGFDNSLIFKVEVDGKEISNPTEYLYVMLLNGQLNRISHSYGGFPKGTTTFERVRLVSKQ